MISKFVMSQNMAVFQSAAFAVFALIYLLMLIWIFRKGSSQAYAKIARGVLDNSKEARRE
jgi:cbb3-type cytochrome oxidase subunit 3